MAEKGIIPGYTVTQTSDIMLNAMYVSYALSVFRESWPFVLFRLIEFKFCSPDVVVSIRIYVAADDLTSSP